jgi:hypothetical protein
MIQVEVSTQGKQLPWQNLYVMLVRTTLQSIAERKRVWLMRAADAAEV